MIDIIIGLLTAGIVQLLKKIKLSNKFAPIAVLIVAVILVSAAKALGFEMDVKTITEAITKAAGVGGATVLAYDQIKKLTEVKK